MLARLSMLLDAKDLDYRKSSLLHGALMERLDTNYASFLHQQQMHPYSQHICKTADGIVWHIQTLNKDAFENIIQPCRNGADYFELKHSGEKINIISQSLEIKEKKELLADFYNEQAERSFSIEMITPTSFKQNGRYFILPDVRLLCQNLMQRYSVTSGNVDMIDSEAMEQIVENTFVSRHRIKSVLFPLEGHSVPGFCGNVTLRCQGTETMTRYLRLLLRFGEYAGIGIKTAVGMGAMRIRRDKGDR